MEKIAINKINRLRLIRNLVMTITILFFLVLACIVPICEISYDEHIVDSVNKKALENNVVNDNITTDFNDGIISYNAQVKYENSIWKLEHKEIYLQSSLLVVILGTVMSILQYLILYSP